jgi:hypothetical protein
MSRLGGLQRWLTRPHEGDAIPVSDALTDEATARRIAETHAAREGQAWRPPIEATLLFHNGGRCWFVRSNATGRGHSVEVVIDDADGTVIETRVLPR